MVAAVVVVVLVVVPAAGVVAGAVQVQAMMALPPQAVLPEVEGPPVEPLPYLYPEGQLG